MVNIILRAPTVNQGRFVLIILMEGRVSIADVPAGEAELLILVRFVEKMGLLYAFNDTFVIKPRYVIADPSDLTSVQQQRT